jgi:hypothetical protein
VISIGGLHYYTKFGPSVLWDISSCICFLILTMDSNISRMASAVFLLLERNMLLDRQIHLFLLSIAIGSKEDIISLNILLY